MRECCRRFDKEVLLRLERGEAEDAPSLDEEFARCPECLEKASAYDALRQRLRAPADVSPAGDWQARVWSGIARRQAAQRRRIQWRIGVAAALSLMIAFLAFRWSPERELVPPEVEIAARAPLLELELFDGAGVRRGGYAEPGDRLRLRATSDSPEASGEGRAHPKASDASPEIRVYFNDRELVLRCRPDLAADPSPEADLFCRRIAGGVEAELALVSRGRYQTLTIHHGHGQGSSTANVGGGLDADSAALLRAGADLFLGEEIEVR